MQSISSTWLSTTRPRVEPGDDAERLLERRLEAEHGVLLVDQPLAGEEVELADPHRQHRQVAAVTSGGGDQPLSSSIATSSRRSPSVELERVDVVLAEPEGAHGDAADLDGLAVAELVDPDPAAVAHELEVGHAAEPGAEVGRDLLGRGRRR